MKRHIKGYILGTLIALTGLYGMITSGFKITSFGSSYLYKFSPFIWKYSPGFDYGYLSLLLWGGCFISGIVITKKNYYQPATPKYPNLHETYQSNHQYFQQ